MVGERPGAISTILRPETNGSRMRHLSRLSQLVLTLGAALAAGQALAADRIPLAEEHRKGITSVHVVGNLAQAEIGTRFHGSVQYFNQPYNHARTTALRSGAAKVEEALGAFDVRPRLKAALEQELGKHPLFQGAEVEVSQQGPLSDEAVLAKGGADAVLVVDLWYAFNDHLEFLIVGATVTLLPTASAADPALKKAFGAGTSALSVTPLYRNLFVTSIPAPGEGDEDEVERWTVGDAAPARLGIEGGVVEVARMLAWDLDQGGPPGGRRSYPVPRESKVELPQLGVHFEAAPVLKQAERVWYRNDDGVLGSMGDTYPGVQLTPMSASPQAAPEAAVPPEADAAGRLTFGFASADLTRQGGAVKITQYSERPGDVAFHGTRFSEGGLAVSGQVGFGQGSRFAGLGPRWQLQRDGAPIDARTFRSITVRLGATTRALRVRLVGRVPPGQDDACHPVHVLEDVDETVKEYTIPLSEFAPEGWCGPKGWEVKEVLPELTGLEVVSNRITAKPLSLWVGATTLNP